MQKIILFTFVFIGLLFSFLAAHWLVYIFAIKFFNITSLLIRNILIWSLVFLGMSFFISTFLSHVADNIFTRGYYLVSGFWIGLLINLLLFFALVWMISIIPQLKNILPNQYILPSVAIFAAIIYSVYGVWNAFSPKVISIDVAIDNLPREWVGKKIVQISDVHLGHVYRENYLADVVAKINNLNPEVVVITGDLFDGTDGSIDSFLSILNNIKVPVFFVTGNHETYLGLDKVYTAIAKTKIMPLRDKLQNMNGLQFIGIDYPLRGDDRDISKIIPKMAGWDDFAPSILLIHEPLQIKNAKKVGISLQLSGHTHKGQLFPFGFVTTLVFGGYDYGFFREGSFAIYTSSGLGGWGPPMRTQNHSEIVQITLR